MPRQAYQSTMMHWHDYIPPHTNPDDKIYVHHRRHQHHTYTKPVGQTASEVPAPHPDGHPQIEDSGK